MKTVFVLLSLLILASCAGGSSSTQEKEKAVWSHPRKASAIYSDLLGKTFNGTNGNVFRFKNDGSVEAQFTGLSETGLNESIDYQKTFTCKITASSYTIISVDNPIGYGSYVIQFNNPTEIRIGVDPSAADVYGCFFRLEPTGQLFFSKDSENTLTFLISNFRIRSPPPNSGYYEGEGRENYVRQ